MSASIRRAAYCDERVCVPVRVSVHEHISYAFDLTNFVHATYDRLLMAYSYCVIVPSVL